MMPITLCNCSFRFRVLNLSRERDPRARARREGQGAGTGEVVINRGGPRMVGWAWGEIGIRELHSLSDADIVRAMEMA